MGVDSRGALTYCRSLCTEPTDPCAQRKLIRAQKVLEGKSKEMRRAHWRRIEGLLPEMERAHLVLSVAKEKEVTNVFGAASGILLIMHYLVVCAVYASGVGCYLLIAQKVELTEAVKNGVAVLDGVSALGWLCLGVFWALIVGYFHREAAQSVKEGMGSLRFVCGGCKERGEERAQGVEAESVFNVPHWERAPQEFKDFLNKTKSQMIRDLDEKEVELHVDGQEREA